MRRARTEKVDDSGPPSTPAANVLLKLSKRSLDPRLPSNHGTYVLARPTTATAPAKATLIQNNPPLLMYRSSRDGFRVGQPRSPQSESLTARDSISDSTSSAASWLARPVRLASITTSRSTSAALRSRSATARSSPASASSSSLP